MAFVLASPQTRDQITVHFEKALGNVSGACQMINREFARRMKGRFAVINREDDAGFAHIPAMRALIRGHEGSDDRMDMTLA